MIAGVVWHGLLACVLAMAPPQTCTLCERASGFSVEVGLQDEGFSVALVRMFEQALQAIARLPEAQRPLLIERLNLVHHASQYIGYGVDDAMSDLLVEYSNYD